MSPSALTAVRPATRRKWASVQAGSTRRLRSVAAELTPEIIAEAIVWYPSATAECEILAERFDVPAEIVADVVAILSPRCRWDRNIHAAERVLSGEEGFIWGPLPENVARARAYLAGDLDRGPSGPKTVSFALNLRGDLGHCTVDVWATRAAVGRDEPRGALEYAAIARSYEIVAAEQGLDVATFQAAVWTWIRGRA